MKLGISIRIFVSFVLALIWFVAIYSPAPAFAETKTILVGDFVNETGDAKWDTVGSALAGSIAVKLGHVKSIKVINEEARRRVMAEQRFGMSGFVDVATAADVGRLSGATHIVYGTYTLVGDDLMAFAYLVNCATGVQEGSCQSVRNRNSTAALINEITEKMLGEIGATATDAEIVRIEKEDIGRTIDTLALQGEIDGILYKNGLMRLDIPKDELLYAKDLCEKILEVEPENTVVLNDIGNIWGSDNGLDDDDKAIYYYEKALQIDPNYALAHYNLGVELHAKGDLDGAIREYRKVMVIDQDDADAHNNLGAALYNKGDLDGAIREYREAIQIDPDYALAYDNLYNALKKSGGLDLVIREFREALRIDPDCALAHKKLGLALFLKGDYDGCIREYRDALRIDPDLKEIRYDIGLTLEMKGDFEGAIREYREAVWVDPDDIRARRCLGSALHGKGDLEGAIHEYRIAIRIDPDDRAAPHFLLGLVLYDKGDFEGAIREYREAIRIDPDYAYEHYQLAVALYEIGKYTEAWEHIIIAMELNLPVGIGSYFIEDLEEASGYNPL